MYNCREIGKIAVLAGGSSSERNISLKSGKAVFRTLQNAGYDVRWIDIKNGSIEKTLQRTEFDVAFITLHGRVGEDGTVQRILEKMAKPYTGSGINASRLALDKIASRRVFEKHGLPVPPYTTTKKMLPSPPQALGFPIVVKPRMEGSSIGLSVVKNRRRFTDACRRAFRYGDAILLEKFIRAKEITVGILGTKALPVIEIVPQKKFYDFHAKYKDKKTEYYVPASLHRRLYNEAQALALAAHKVLGCRDFSRVDMLIDESDNLYLLELNTIPGLTERSLLPKAAKAEGISFTKLCTTLLELAIKNRSKKW